jgi:hypothetical protein
MSELKSLRNSLGYHWTLKSKNNEVLNEFKITSVVEKINVHKTKRK